MILEMHLIQNFAPSNLNRSDTGSPKDCTFGGYRRARISSQSFKRAIREYYRANFHDQEKLAERSTRLSQAISEQLVEAGYDPIDSGRVVAVALSGLKIIIQDGRTQYLIFLGRDEIKRVAEICIENFDALLEVAPKAKAAIDEEGNEIEISAADLKRQSSKVPKEVVKELNIALDGGKASDLALFGRMLADMPKKNRDASSQVAHAISTHKTGIEFDFFTAVDDLIPDDESGADMLGTIEFNSACFYRYLNVDTDLLVENLQGDAELARETLKTFIRATVEAIPTGKQNSFATHESPSFVLAVVRDSGMCSLANAFEKPVSPNRKKSLVEDSIEKLDQHWQKLTSVYGDSTSSKACIVTNDAELESLASAQCVSFDDLIEKTISEIYQGG